MTTPFKKFVYGAISDASPAADEFDTDMTSADDDIYNGNTVVLFDAGFVVEARVISDYDGTNKTITVSPALPDAPANGTEFVILPWGGLPQGVAPDVNVASVDSGAIDADALATDLDTYQAKLWLIDDDGAGTPTDRYVVAFYKNAEPIVAGITSPTIWVYSLAASPVDLVGTSGSPQVLTQAGATGTYFHDETSSRIADGMAYMVRVQATMGGSTRTWYQPVGRDSV